MISAQEIAELIAEQAQEELEKATQDSEEE